ncbi:RraA family protein, partial [Escherichia coli]|uniref:RraA family protein n=1 Tax=Escherichia coli TaxID=562 RepID=UPI003C6CD5A0
CSYRPYFGELIASAAKAVGFRGMVCDGLVRDRDGCSELGLPVFARGFLQRGPVKKNPGKINEPIRCAGIMVNPGDLVVGDCDGVTVVPRELV